MKFVSYIIIVIVMSIIGWSTDNSLDSIFPPKEPELVKLEQLAKVTEKETLPGLVDSFLE